MPPTTASSPETPEPFSDAESEFVVTLPVPPDDPARAAFPVFALAAPVIASGVMFAVTSSPFVLVFAVFGPLLALAALGDARRAMRRTRRDAEGRYRAGWARASARVTALHVAERRILERLWPPPRALATVEPGSTGAGPPGFARIGCAAVASRVRIAGEVRQDTGVTARVRGVATPGMSTPEELITASKWLLDAPLVVDFAGGVAYCGPDALARAALRASLLQLAWRFDPATVAIRWTEHPDLGWLARLPHQRLGPPLPPPLPPCPDGLSVEFVALARDGVGSDGTTAGGAAVARLVCQRAPSPLAPRMATVVDFSAGSAVVRRRSADPDHLDLQCDLVSMQDAVSLSGSLAEKHTAGEKRSPGLPPRVAWGDVPRKDDGAVEGTARRSLWSPIGVSHSGALGVDLVHDGPHAAVAGTTGSGKSELLMSWVLGLAHRYRPRDVNVLLVDFKGGATFGPLASLPHSVGVVTDLDGDGTRRAVESLRAEVLFRERVLAAEKVATIDALPDHASLPRLVIVVDEFAALGASAPELLPVFAAVAARGRSLGMHLLLGTQRASGALSDDILSNCAIRVALRLSSTADSTLVIGAGAACELPRIPGRALLSVGGEAPTALQVPLASAGDVRSVVARWPRETLRRPWCEPLPTSVGVADLPGQDEVGRPFGLADRPSEQRYRVATWDPATDGALLVVGATGSGRTSALRALVRSTSDEVRWMPQDPPSAWDFLHRIRDEIGAGRCSTTLAIDDVDLVVSRFGPDHREQFVDTLVGIIREAPATGLAVVASLRGAVSMLHPVISAFQARLVLRVPSRHDALLLGEEPRSGQDRLPPGRGFWKGDLVQVISAGSSRALDVPGASGAPLAIESGQSVAIITAAPEAVSRALRSLAGVEVTTLGSAPIGSMASATAADTRARAAAEPGGLTTTAPAAHALVGDAAAWQADFRALTLALQRGGLVVHGCSVQEYRVLTGSRSLPPPLPPGRAHAWQLGVDGAVARVLLPFPPRSPGQASTTSSAR